MSKKLKEWFDRDCAIRLGRAVQSNFSRFDVGDYADEVEAGVGPLELKSRVKLTADGLRARLPDDFEEAAVILAASLGPPLEGETGMFTKGYWLMPVARLVEDHGLDHIETSMALCTEITRRNTAEYAVRPYIEADPERALGIMLGWTASDDLHIRRLASEGVRPRLPWAKKLDMFVADPTQAITLVSVLRADPSRYVQTSVANLINDVSRDHPETVIELAWRWSRENNENTDWITRHATRTLRKSGALPKEFPIR